MLVIASIQARMNSERLPGKVLAPIEGRPMIAWQVERLRASDLVDEVVVATSDNQADDVLAEWCHKSKVAVYRGSEHDVLGRVTGCVREYEADIHVEAFGDSPLVDPQVVDRYVGRLAESGSSWDVVSNAFSTTFPPGLEVVTYWSEALFALDDLVDPEDPLREHVGSNFLRFENRFRLDAISATPSELGPDIFLEVDTPEDLAVMRHVIGAFRNDILTASVQDLLNFASRNPDLFDTNRDVERRWRARRRPH